MERSDEELLSAIAAEKDRDAFRVLFGRFAGRLKGYFAKAGARNPEELVQEVMLTAWMKAEQFDAGRASVSTWLFTIGRNRMIDRIRRERRPAPDPHDPAFVPEQETADETLDRHTEGEKLRQAMEKLPPEQAQVLLLSYSQEKSLAQVADELGIPLGTAKSRARAAMQRLRTLLTEDLS